MEAVRKTTNVLVYCCDEGWMDECSMWCEHPFFLMGNPFLKGRRGRTDWKVTEGALDSRQASGIIAICS